jgi:hypothetical protein
MYDFLHKVICDIIFDLFFLKWGLQGVEIGVGWRIETLNPLYVNRT